MHEKIHLGITAPEGTREYTKQRTAAIIRLGVEAEKPLFATDQFGEYAAAITLIPGVYDVAMHGSPKCSEVFGHKTTARNVAAILRQRDVKARSTLLNHSRTSFELKFPRQMIYYGQGTITLSQ